MNVDTLCFVKTFQLEQYVHDQLSRCTKTSKLVAMSSHMTLIIVEREGYDRWRSKRGSKRVARVRNDQDKD
jgi:hypothetical protein